MLWNTETAASFFHMKCLCTKSLYLTQKYFCYLFISCGGNSQLNYIYYMHRPPPFYSVWTCFAVIVMYWLFIQYNFSRVFELSYLIALMHFNVKCKFRLFSMKTWKYIQLDFLCHHQSIRIQILYEIERCISASLGQTHQLHEHSFLKSCWSEAIDRTMNKSFRK